VRVTVVGPTYPYKGGIARHVTELAHHLAAASHGVTIESWRAQYPPFLYPGRQTLDQPESELFEPTVRQLAWYRPDGWLRVGRRLGATSELVVLTVLSPVQVPPYLAMVKGVAGRARTLALCHNVLPHERHRFDVALMRRLLTSVDGVIVHSAEQAELARSLTGRPVGNAPLAPHLPVPPQPLPVPGQPYDRLLFFGMVRPYKGLDVLLKALAQGPPSARLLVAGEFWGGSAPTEALVAELGLQERVEIRSGYVPTEALPGLFAAVDALVLPYRAGTASQNAWLAFQFGVPVIATRAGTFADAVTDGVDGIVCRPDDVADLAAALGRFYSPGEALRLRAGVRPVDPEPYWQRYLGVLLSVGA
jgi:glycosyltransferase involved in cell wall biosynthesis